MTGLSHEGQQSVTLSSNFLRFNNQTLVASEVASNGYNPEVDHLVDPSELFIILDMGRTAILEGIEDFYAKTVERNPGSTVVHPSIFTVRMGYTESRVLSELGQRNNTSVHTNRDEMTSYLREYWDSTLKAGFTPELRSRIGGKKPNEATWLLVRKPRPNHRS